MFLLRVWQKTGFVGKINFKFYFGVYCHSEGIKECHCMMGFGTFTCEHRGLTELFHVRTCKAMALPLVRAAKRTHRMWWKCEAEVGGFQGCLFSQSRKLTKKFHSRCSLHWFANWKVFPVWSHIASLMFWCVTWSWHRRSNVVIGTTKYATTLVAPWLARIKQCKSFTVWSCCFVMII